MLILDMGKVWNHTLKIPPKDLKETIEEGLLLKHAMEMSLANCFSAVLQSLILKKK